MRRRILVSIRSKKKKNNRLSRILSIFTATGTIGVLVVMTLTLCSQKGFNKRQIEFNERVLKLSEASAVPQVFAEFDSLIPLKSKDDYNVFYTVRNVGNTPAFKLRLQCQVNDEKVNRLELATSGVTADLFPTETKRVSSQGIGFMCKGNVCALYFHVRLDYQDMLEDKYCYKATYWIFATGDDPPSIRMFKSGMEKSEFFPLNER